MLTSRRPNVDDVPEIEDISRDKNYPLPQKFEHAAVVEKTHPESGCKEIVAFGVLRNDCEAILYLKSDEGKKEKAIALQELIAKAKSDALSLGHEDIYLFAETDEFAEILVKHYGFRKCKGVPLILDL